MSNRRHGRAGVAAASEDAAALQPIIDGLREMGYSMTAVSDLIAP